VASFVDRVLIQFAAPAALEAALAPGGGAALSDLVALVGSVYDLTHVRIDRVTAVTVSEVRVQQPLFPAEHHRGTWTRTQPAYVSTDVAIDSRSATAPVWVDLLARIRVHTVSEVDPGGIESALTKGLADFTSVREFRDQFRFIDLDDFMARHHLVTVDDLREAFEYLLTEVHLRKPRAFDPADPANAHDIELDLALLVADGVDLAAVLRSAATVREVADQTRVAPKDALLGMPDSALAVAVVLGETALTDAGLTAAAVRQLLARERVLCLVTDPP
jgi:hypothetical protein